MIHKKIPLFTGITVDDTTSRDLDDGFWIEEQNEYYLLRVFISNVSSKVHPRAKNSTLYEMAHTRVETQYFRSRHDPMLPIGLSEDKLSLLPGEKRQAICFEFKIDKQSLEVKYFAFFECIFKSIRKMNYTEVHSFLTSQELLNPIPEDIQKVITIASSLASNLLKRRRIQGALIVYDVFNTYTISEEGKLVFIAKEKHHGYILVQELMILVNARVADFAVKESVPLLFRTHRVKSDYISRDDLLREFNLLQASRDPQTLQMIQYRVDHMLELAQYQMKHGEHWALSLPWYTHVTSPIRRFADLVNQVNLIAFLREEDYPFQFSDIERIGQHINQVVAEHETARTEYAKATLAEEFPKDMNIEWLSGLNPNHLTRNLKLACNIAGVINGYFIQELETRITEDRLQVLDYTYLLFEEKFTTYEKIRKDILTLLIECKVRIKPLYYLLCQRLQIPFPEVQIQKQGDNFVASILFFFNDTEYKITSPPGRNKKEASELGYAGLLIKMFNIETALNAQIQSKKKRVVPFVLPNEVPDGNYISILQECAHRAQIESPTYVLSEISQRGITSFRCTATFNVEDKIFSTSEKGGSKKIAKAYAACALYKALKKAQF